MNQNSAQTYIGSYAAAWETVAPKILEFVHGFANGQVDHDSINNIHWVAAKKNKLGAIMLGDYRLICWTTGMDDQRGSECESLQKKNPNSIRHASLLTAKVTQAILWRAHPRNDCETKYNAESAIYQGVEKAVSKKKLAIELSSLSEAIIQQWLAKLKNKRKQKLNEKADQEPHQKY